MPRTAVRCASCAPICLPITPRKPSACCARLPSTPRTTSPCSSRPRPIWNWPADHARAAGPYDTLLAASPDHPHLVKALKAANLWEYGHEAEARAIIDGLRTAAPLDPAPWEIVAETLEHHDELEEAHDSFTAALNLLLTPGEEVPYSTHTLLIGRHRVRRLLGLDHDPWDALADSVHPSPVGLDELHDPKRLWSLGSDNPAELQAEIARLRAELGSYRTALSRPFPVAVLHW